MQSRFPHSLQQPGSLQALGSVCVCVQTEQCSALHQLHPAIYLQPGPVTLPFLPQHTSVESEASLHSSASTFSTSSSTVSAAPPVVSVSSSLSSVSSLGLSLSSNSTVTASTRSSVATTSGMLPLMLNGGRLQETVSAVGLHCVTFPFLTFCRKSPSQPPPWSPTVVA